MSEEQKNVPEEDLTEMPETSSPEPATKEEIPVIQKLTKTENSKKEIGTMEVHHHGHVHEKKKWLEYLFQFLMLFLAVFLGFFAENQREHIIEKLRAKEYAKALLGDLAADTTEILDVIREDKILLTCFDSIKTTVHNPLLNNKVPGSFYYYCHIGTASPAVVWANATITQITQSGNLRYFENRELIKKISSYYSTSHYITDLNNIDRRYREKSMELKSRVLNNYFYSQYSPYRILDWLNIPDSLMKARLPLQSYDPDLLNEFANSFENRRANLGIIMKNVYPAALDAANELSGLLKKEYHLK
jgi:hypothetical protein